MKKGFSPKELKSILFSKRANIYYLENVELCKRTAESFISKRETGHRNIGTFLLSIQL